MEPKPNQAPKVKLPNFLEKVSRGGAVYAGKHLITAGLAYVLAGIFSPTIANKLWIVGQTQTQEQKSAIEKRQIYLKQQIKLIEDRQKELDNKGILPGFLKEWSERTFTGQGVSPETSVNKLRLELSSLRLRENIQDSKDYVVWLAVFSLCLWYLTEPIGNILKGIEKSGRNKNLVNQINSAIEELFKKIQALEEKVDNQETSAISKEEFILEAEKIRTEILALLDLTNSPTPQPNNQNNNSKDQ